MRTTSGKARTKRWTEAEDEAIRQHYEEKGSKYLVKLLGRSRSAVQGRAQKIGVWGGDPRWKPVEEEYMRERYHDTSRAEMAEYLGRSIQAINHKLRFMGLTEQQSRPWEPEEIAFLRDHYGTMTCEEIADELLDRTHEAVSLKAQRIGLAKRIRIIDERERDWVIENLGTISYLNMSIELDVGISQILKIAKEVGHRPRGTTRLWSEADDRFIRENYRTMKGKEIAAALDRTVPAVRTRAKHLGVTKRPETPQRRWTPKEEAIVRTQWSKKSAADIARILKRTRNSVIGKAATMGLKRQ